MQHGTYLVEFKAPNGNSPQKYATTLATVLFIAAELAGGIEPTCCMDTKISTGTDMVYLLEILWIRGKGLRMYLSTRERLIRV